MKNSIVFVTLCVLAFTTAWLAGAPLQSPQGASDTFFWHGELVALDQSARTMTVKSMVVGGALHELGNFKTGDRIVLGWSGLDKYANAINHAVRVDGTKKSEERFTFPVEFVAFDATQKYLTFKAPVPAESISKLQSLKPGQWVTATSPQGKAVENQPIVAVRSYNEPANS